MKIIVDHGGDIKTEHDLIKSELYCPVCGQKTLWKDCDSDDYYLGCTYYCINCKREQLLDHTDRELDIFGENILEQIATYESNTRTT